MSSLDTRTNYKGEVFSYTGSNQSYYLMAHRAQSIESELTAFCEPFVELGFSAEQIKQELDLVGNRLVPIGHINAVVSRLLQEQI